MAIKTIEPMKKMEWNAISEPVVFTAASVAADGFAIPYSERDSRIVLLVQNSGSAAGTLTVKKGNGLQGVADTEAFAIGASQLRAITLESMKFKNVSGPNKGNVIAVPSGTDIKLAAVILP